MIKAKKLIWVMGCALAVSGCAAFFQSKVVSLKDIDVKPVESIKHAGFTPEIMYLLGRYYQGKIHYKKAIDAYKKALSARPAYVEAHNGLGVIYSTLGQFDLADRHFSTAIELAPMNSYLHNNLGYAYLIQGRENEAAEFFKKALETDPGNEQARLNLATTYKRLGQDDTLALKYLKPEPKALQTAPVVADKVTESKEPSSQLVQIAPNVYEYHEAKQRKAPQSIATATATAGAGAIAADIHPKKNNLNQQNQFPERIEVSNGNGIAGMARQVSRFLNQYGFVGIRLTNHQPFQQTETEIHYRNGRLQHSKQLAQLLPQPVKFIESEDLRHDIQIKILLGRDMSSELTYFAENRGDQHVKLSTHLAVGQTN